MVENISLYNKSINATLELDMVTTPHYILESVTWGEVEGEHHEYKYVNQIGVYITGTSLGTRDVEINGWIIADTEEQMTARKMSLNRFVNPQQMLELSYSGYRLNFYPDSSIKYSTVAADNNEVVCKFMIVGTAADPLFRDRNDEIASGASTKPMFHFPLVINKVEKVPPTVMFGLRDPSLFINISNVGTISTGMRIVFKALGDLVNPSLINVYTQDFFKINKEMHTGEVIEINTNIGEKKVFALIDKVKKNYFRYRDLDSTWLQLDVGVNIFKFDADKGLENLEVYIYFSNKFLEVQQCY